MDMTLDEISKLLGEITEGPWEVGYSENTPSRGGQFWWIRCPRGALGYMPKPDVHDDNYVRFTKEDARLIAAAPTIIKELGERVRKLELDVMRVDVVLEAAKAVVEDGDYDVHYESRSAALIDSGLLLRLENAVKAIDAAKEST